MSMDRTDIQLRLYKATLYASAGLSLICIWGNYISAFPFRISLKWILFFLVCTLAFFLSRNKKLLSTVMFAFFSFLIFLFLPFAFADSGGSNNNALGYSFLLTIAITYLFNGWKRIFLVLGLIAVLMSLIFLEHFHPQLIMEYSDSSQFYDRIIQVPLLIFMAFFCIQIFVVEYEHVLAELDKYANYDSLTQLYNRRMFDKAMEEAISDHKSNAYLALIDIDNFKVINDQFGHSVGDDVLRNFGALLLSAFSNGRHITARWGGDEFAIIFYGDQKSLESRLIQVREHFQSYLIPFRTETDISFSITPVKESTRVDQILLQADGSLYQQKRKNKSQD